MYKRLLVIFIVIISVFGVMSFDGHEEIKADQSTVEGFDVGYIEAPEIDITDELAKSREILDYSESTCISDGGIC